MVLKFGMKFRILFVKYFRLLYSKINWKRIANVLIKFVLNWLHIKVVFTSAYRCTYVINNCLWLFYIPWLIIMYHYSSIIAYLFMFSYTHIIIYVPANNMGFCPTITNNVNSVWIIVLINFFILLLYSYDDAYWLT